MPQLVCFFETAAECDTLSRWMSERPRNCTYVAIKPDADYAAESRGIPHHSIEEFYPDGELATRTSSMATLADDLCDFLDRRLQEDARLRRLLNGFSARRYYYCLNALLDGLHGRALALQKVFEALRPSAAVCFETLRGPITDDLFFVRDSLPCRLIPIIARNSGVPLTVLPTISGRGAFAPVTLSWRKTLRRVWYSETLRQVVRRLRAKLGLRRHSWSDPTGKGDPTLVTVNVWSDYEFMDRAAASGMKVIPLEETLSLADLPGLDGYARQSGLRERLLGVWLDMVQDKTLHSIFSVRGTNFFPVVSSRLRHFILNMVPRHVHLASAVTRCLRQLKNPAFLSSSPLPLLPVAALEAARRTHTPRIVLQHGGMGYHESTSFPYTELACADAYLCYSQGVVEYARNRAGSRLHRFVSPATRLIAVGSPAIETLLDTARRRKDLPGRVAPRGQPRPRYVLYAVTGLSGDIHYLSGSAYPDIWYWRLQRKVVRTCCEFPGVRLLVKLSPYDWVPNPLAQWIHDEGFSNCETYQWQPFPSLFDQADLFIIDYPSTTLLQAVATNKPIVAYSSLCHIPLLPEAITLLKKRVQLSTSPEEFLRDIRAQLERPAGETSQTVNDEFLRRYGVPSDGGTSTERIINAIHTIIQATRR